jgi:large subunit ribosomal protein L25
MSEPIIAAEPRERAGKGAARATRRAGRVPGVIYGDKKDSVMISLDPVTLMKQARTHGFFSTVYQVEVGGEKHRVLARDLQLHPVSDQPMHVDFMRVTKGQKLTVDVEVTFENETKSPGLKRGGVLNVVRHAVEVMCTPGKIPDHFSLDLTGLDIGDSLHASSIALPEGVELTITDRDFTIATVAAPSAVKAAAAEEEEAEEGAEEAAEEAATEE